jgi:subfamily B ATP-binding cassette protein HlyB/CyaB
MSAVDASSLLDQLCRRHGVPFDAALLRQQFPPPHALDAIVPALRQLGFEARVVQSGVDGLQRHQLPFVACLRGGGYALVVGATGGEVEVAGEGEQRSRRVPVAAFAADCTGTGVEIRRAAPAPQDPDADLKPRAFGFRWFAAELLKHRQVWRHVLLASLFLQLLGLAFPLVTQAVVDKVVVHRTDSTLVVLGVAMGIFVVFSALLAWVRQYLVMHTGNRVDAVLGATVFSHLFRLPVRYFEQRSTGVITARLYGVEKIREFIASAAITLVLDVPFLLIGLALMMTYSVVLTLVVLVILGAIGLMSLLVAPVLQRRMNDQFLLGARNQAFITEHVAGYETVKSLQLEPLLNARYGTYLASYLQSGFAARQAGNSYNTVANALQQLMTVLVLMIGAWMVMHPAPGDAVFTIGMLVAFQMFATRISQPLLRLVGLWQQFQQASLSIARLGDLMNAQPETYSLVPARYGEAAGLIEFRDVGFRYRDELDWIYRDVQLTVQPGSAIAIMGPSGAGKSTLAKLLQGFYRATEGSIRLDSVDVAHLSANELRSHFGVVPQDTVLFSGTVYDNLVAGNPQATFDDIVQACRRAEIHTTIMAMPKGYQTEIGERGTGLSGGQKQRIAIARALLRRPKVLVFDEPTSSLDAATAEAFAATVNQLKGQVTMIFVTHALPRTLHVDEVYMVRDGTLRKAMARVKDEAKA